MSSCEINSQRLSSKKLKDRFDLYGRFSVCSVDMSKPEVIKINETPAKWCSNSFIKINLEEDGVNLYDAQPGEGRFIAKIFDFEKNRPELPPGLQFSQHVIKLSEMKVNWSNRTSQELFYNWRNGTKHKFLISACFPAIRCTIIDSTNIAIQLKTEYIKNIEMEFQQDKPYYILWGKTKYDTPLVISFPSGLKDKYIRNDVILFTSPSNRFVTHIGPLFGAALIDTRKIETLPDEWDERAKIIAQGSCNMPVDFSENYEVDDTSNKINITRRFIRSKVENTSSDNKYQNISIYPPSVFYPQAGGKTGSKTSFEIYTLYGKTYFSHYDDINYSFEIPPELDQRLAIPDLNEINKDFDLKVVDLLNERIKKELDEIQEFPKFSDYGNTFTYSFVALAQQMLACHTLLHEDIKKELIDWTHKHLEYFFDQKWIDQDFFGFSYPEGHWAPYDIDCYCGNIFLCVTHYLEASGDIEFVKRIFPKIKKMLNYFRIAIDPMMSNGFCSTSWHLNWVSDTLETVTGLFGIARIARYIDDDIWHDIVGFAATYRCGAIGLLFGKYIYNEIPGLPTKASWLFDHWDSQETMLNYYNYPLSCMIAIDATYGFIPLAYEKSFWHLYLPFWPLCPELCLLHLNLNWKEKFKAYFEILEKSWPDWRTSPEATFAHGAPFLIFRSLYGQENPKELLAQYLQGEKIHKTRPFLEFTRWKHFIMACLLVDPDNPIKKQDKLVK